MPFFLIMIFVSCQTSRHNQLAEQAKLEKGSRYLANADVWTNYILKLSQETKLSEAAIEGIIIKYFQHPTQKGIRPNYLNAGITTEEKVLSIKSMKDDLPFMPKVRKWTMENMDKILKKDKDMISKIYSEIVIGDRGVKNKYNFRPAKRSERRRKLNPNKSLDEKSAQLNESITAVGNNSQQIILRRNLSISKKRGIDSPAVYANGQVSVESAALISQKTGINAMGDGCKDFMYKASSEVLEIKANIDLYAAELIEQMAYNKAGRRFASHRNIKNPELLLTQADIDQARVIAIRKVQKISNEKAQEALSTLKGKPCRLY